MPARRDQLSPDSSVLRSNVDDSAVVARCLQGDTEAYGVIVDRYQTPLFNTALRMTGDYEIARDVTQNALVRAYEKLSTYRSDHKFFSWLYRILVNDALNVIRHGKFVQDMPAETPDSGRTPEEDYLKDERHRAIDEAIRELNFDQRLVIVLRHFNDMNYEQMAVILAIPTKTVKSRLYSARQNLARILERKGLGAL